MKNIIKNAGYAIAWTSLLWLNSVNATINFTGPLVQEGVKWSGESLDQAIQIIVSRIATFLYIIALVIAIYAWFLILASGWKEEDVKKWKNLIIYAIVWIAVIWFANSIIRFAIWILTV